MAPGVLERVLRLVVVLLRPPSRLVGEAVLQGGLGLPGFAGIGLRVVGRPWGLLVSVPWVVVEIGDVALLLLQNRMMFPSCVCLLVEVVKDETGSCLSSFSPLFLFWVSYVLVCTCFLFMLGDLDCPIFISSHLCRLAVSHIFTSFIPFFPYEGS